MIVFLWWTLSICAAVGVGGCGGVIWANYRVHVVVEEARITAPLADARVELTELQAADVLAFSREVLLDDEPRGRHDHRVAIGTSAQRARVHQITHEFHALVGGTWSAEERADLEAAIP